MNRNSVIHLFFLCVLMQSCTKDVDLSKQETVSRIVIEGRISSLEGPYYVRVTRSMGLAGRFDYDPMNNTVIPVKGATVIITEEAGIADTLISSAKEGPVRYMYSFNTSTRKIDSVLARRSNEPFIKDRGYYETTKLKGRPGQTYHLLVKVDGEEYHATARMPPVPVLDSAKLAEAVVTPDERTNLIPFAWFSEPQQEKNYYQLMFNDITDYKYDNAYFDPVAITYLPFYILDDQTLPAYVNGIGVRVTSSAHYDELDWEPYLSVHSQAVQLKLCSLTKEAYSFFNSLNRQLQDDGNVYEPVPSSAAGNISNNAIGLFWASDISYRLVLPK